MESLKFNRELYSKISLIKAAYNFTDRAYVHLDADNQYYYVTLESKDPKVLPDEAEFTNEMLAQSVRHEIYLQTKNIRELMLARAMATSVIYDSDTDVTDDAEIPEFSEDEILRDWFSKDDTKTV